MTDFSSLYEASLEQRVAPVVQRTWAAFAATYPSDLDVLAYFSAADLGGSLPVAHRYWSAAPGGNAIVVNDSRRYNEQLSQLTDGEVTALVAAATVREGARVRYGQMIVAGNEDVVYHSVAEAVGLSLKQLHDSLRSTGLHSGSPTADRVRGAMRSEFGSGDAALVISNSLTELIPVALEYSHHDSDAGPIARAVRAMFTAAATDGWWDWAPARFGRARDSSPSAYRVAAQLEAADGMRVTGPRGPARLATELWRGEYVPGAAHLAAANALLQQHHRASVVEEAGDPEALTISTADLASARSKLTMSLRATSQSDPDQPGGLETL